ncbi:hypothetical protein [Streptomyces tremellae]|uniref:Uncharacterized protein n=1 Tax=Streptomyces tremellae TaxID=1124239 RepID=A0ABP7E5C5_9ACTN
MEVGERPLRLSERAGLGAGPEVIREVPHAPSAPESLDSLSGRAAPLPEVLSGPAGPRDALGLLATAMNR